MKNKYLYWLTISIVLVLAALPAGAVDLGFAKEDGGQPGAFLDFGAGARSLGMGKAFTGIADDASATYWNPAGLTQLKEGEMTALYASLYENTGFGFVSYAQPLGGRIGGSFGIAFANLNSGGFPLRDELNVDQGIASVSENAVLLSYGRKLTDYYGNVSGGVTLKAVNQNVNGVSGSGFGADAAFLWTLKDTIFKSFSVGASIQNLVAPSMRLRQEADSYPLTFNIGLGYRPLDGKLLLALDVSKIQGREVKVRIGGEYAFGEIFAFRLGIDETEITSGVGFKWNGYSLDYAFAYHDAWSGYEDLGMSHRFGVTARFGKK